MRPEVGIASDALVVELASRGKHLAGEPYFVPGTALALDRRTDGRPGDLAVVRKGRGRARVERVLGPASSIEVVLEGLLVEQGELRGFEPYDPPTNHETSAMCTNARSSSTVRASSKSFAVSGSIVNESRSRRSTLPSGSIAGGS